VATAPAVVGGGGGGVKCDDSSPNVPVSQSLGSTPSASQSDTASEHEPPSPDVDHSTVKPASSASHSSLVSALSLAPVTHVSHPEFHIANGWPDYGEAE
jgi:hypothetical protein